MPEVMEDAIWALSPYKNITHKMLNAGPDNRDLRKYVVDKVKAPLRLTIYKIGGERPSVLSHNGNILAEIADQFLKYDGDGGGGRTPMFAAGFNVMLRAYENPDAVKIPLAVRIFGLRYPRPTLQNTDLPNTHLLLKLQDEFFARYPELDNADFRAVWRIFICEYHHDIHYYGARMDWWVEQLANHIIDQRDWQMRDSWIDWLILRLMAYVKAGFWKPRPPHHPHYQWAEPVLNDFWGSFGLKGKIHDYIPENQREGILVT